MKIHLVVIACVTVFITVNAHAQTILSIGPRLGFNASTAPYANAIPFDTDERSYQSGYRPGLEAGVTASLGFGHFAVQPSLLYSQKGFGLDTDRLSRRPGTGNDIRFTSDAKYRLNYVTLPVNVAYTLQAGGQGFQLFAGPYLGYLLGGDYSSDDIFSVLGSASPNHREARIKANSAERVYDPNAYSADTNLYARRFDFGVQAGLGYRLGAALLQVSYSQGISNAGVRITVDAGVGGSYVVADPTYRNRAFQLSLAYLFGPEK